MNTGAGDSYTAFEDLEDVYLEDSWVLRLAAAESSVAFTLEAVLGIGHSEYTSPESDQQYCYRTATLLLCSDTPITYELSGQRPHIDPDGSTDLGNIDTFEALGRDTWRLTGDWGRITITNPKVTLTLDIAP